MSITTGYDRELMEQLVEAGLPSKPSKLIGRPYRFGYESGSHLQILVGTITGIMISDEGGLELEVSNLTFTGQKLLGIMRDQDRGKWMAHVDAQQVEDRFFPGRFDLL